MKKRGLIWRIYSVIQDYYVKLWNSAHPLAHIILTFINLLIGIPTVDNGQKVKPLRTYLKNLKHKLL